MFKFNTIEEALEDLRQGKVVLCTDDPDRENEGDFICAAEFATTENVNFMAVHGKGLICMPMSIDLCKKLQFPQMVIENTDNHETAFTVSIDHVDTTTGISAEERGLTARKVVDQDAKPTDFRRPGHMFPLMAKPNGVLERNGHTEAIGFCKSPEKTGFRRRILEILTLLPLSDERDVLEYAAELVKSAKAWVDVVQSEQAEAINESEEFLSKAALKQIEARNKRVLTKASLESLAQVTSIIRSWLRDVLMIKSQAVEQIVNIDVMNDLEQAAARTTPAGLVRAIDATYRCDKAIAYNVSTETCLDTLLFTIREVFYGSGGSH